MTTHSRQPQPTPPTDTAANQATSDIIGAVIRDIAEVPGDAESGSEENVKEKDDATSLSDTELDDIPISKLKRPSQVVDERVQLRRSKRRVGGILPRPPPVKKSSGVKQVAQKKVVRPNPRNLVSEGEFEEAVDIEDLSEPTEDSVLGKPAAKPRKIPSLESLKGWLRFDTLDLKARLLTKHDSDITPYASFDFASLDPVGVGNRIKEYMLDIGWECMLSIMDAAYSELCLEFHTSFWFDHNTLSIRGKNRLNLDAPEIVNFKLCDVWEHLSVNGFNLLLGFVTVNGLLAPEYLNALCDYPDDWDKTVAYQELTGDPEAVFDKHSKAHQILDPALRMIHRSLSYNLSGKTTVSGNMSKVELFLLWCIVHKKRVNLGYWIARQLHAGDEGAKMILGSFITKLAVTSRGLNLATVDLHRFCDVKILDMRAFDQMGYFHLVDGYVYYNVGFTDVEEHIWGKKYDGRHFMRSIVNDEIPKDGIGQAQDAPRGQDGRTEQPSSSSSPPSWARIIMESQLNMQ